MRLRVFTTMSNKHIVPALSMAEFYFSVSDHFLWTVMFFKMFTSRKRESGVFTQMAVAVAVEVVGKKSKKGKIWRNRTTRESPCCVALTDRDECNFNASSLSGATGPDCSLIYLHF